MTEDSFAAFKVEGLHTPTTDGDPLLQPAETFNYRGQGPRGLTGDQGPESTPGPTLPQQPSYTAELQNPPITFKGLLDAAFGFARLAEAEDDYAADGEDNLKNAEDLLTFIQLISEDNRS